MLVSDNIRVNGIPIHQFIDLIAPGYLLSADEPKDNNKMFTRRELNLELSERRLFLKHRVWRNMRKVRRHQQEQDLYVQPALKTLRQHPVGW